MTQSFHQILVLLQQEDCEDPDGVDHEEGEDHLVPELLQGIAHLFLLFGILLQRLQVLLDQVEPESDFLPDTTKGKFQQQARAFFK